MAARPTTLKGATIGLLDNSKHNSKEILDRIEAALHDELGVAQVTRFRKQAGSFPAPEEMVDEIVARCDAVITGVGDCGSCSSCSVHDSITLEKRGIPSALICTDIFESTVKAMSAAQGMPSYPHVVLKHPIARIPEPELNDKADQAVDAVRGLLLAR